MRFRTFRLLGLVLAWVCIPSAFALEKTVADSADVSESVSASRSWSLTPELGLARVSYDEAFSSPFTQTASILRLGYDYRFESSPWSIGVNGYGTLLVLAYNENEPIHGAHFYGGDIYGMRPILGQDRELQLRMVAGLAFRGMVVGKDEDGRQSYGYRSAIAYELYPTLAWNLSRDRELSGYFKYLPLTNDLFNPLTRNRELALGAVYRFSALTERADSAVRVEWLSQFTREVVNGVHDAKLSMVSFTFAQRF